MKLTKRVSCFGLLSKICDALAHAGHSARTPRTLTAARRAGAQNSGPTAKLALAGSSVGYAPGRGATLSDVAPSRPRSSGGQRAQPSRESESECGCLELNVE